MDDHVTGHVPAVRIQGLGARVRAAVAWGWLTLPGLALLGFVFLYPLVIMLMKSFTDPSPANYAGLFEDGLYPRVLLRTMQMGLFVTLFCVLVGYPYAYLLCRVSKRWMLLLFAAVLLPLWTSWLVRTFAWMALLSDKGVINNALISAGIIDDPLPLIRNSFGVTIGMSYILLPFMILPLYANMRKIDWQLVQAARGLGATPRQSFLRVFLPLSLPGVVAGSLLVFAVAVGFYVTPALLGGASNVMLGQLIVNRFSGALEFGEGSAMGVVLLIAVGLVLIAGSKISPMMKSLDGGKEQ